MVKGTVAYILILLFSLHTAAEDKELRRTINITEAKGMILENGVPLIAYRDSSSKTTVLRFFFRCGRFDDTEGRSGLAFSTARIVSSFQNDTMVKEFMESGSEIRVAVKGDFTVITLKCLTSHLKKMIKIVGRMIKKPLINGIRLQSVVKSMKRAIRSRDDDPYMLMEKEIMKSFFNSPGYGGALIGSMDSVERITVQDIRKFYDSHLSFGNLLVVAASDLAPDKCRGVIDEEFGKLKVIKKVRNGERSGVLKSGNREPVVIKRIREQALISCSFVTEEPGTAGFALMSLFQAVTGKGIGSRLWKLREPLNLAYDVNVKLYFMKKAGVMNCYFSTSMENWQKGLKEFRQILNNLKENGVTAEELEKGKKTAIVSFLREKESKDMRTWLLGSYELLGAGYDKVCRYHDEINRIGLEDFNNFLKKLFSTKKCQYIIIGPEKKDVLKEVS